MRISDWSSDVCSSDLRMFVGGRLRFHVAIAIALADPADRSLIGVGVQHRDALSVAAPVSGQRGRNRGLAGAALAGGDHEHACHSSFRSPGAASIHNGGRRSERSEEHTSELQSLMRISYAVFCLKKKN